MLPDRRRLLIAVGLVVALGVTAWNYLGASGARPGTAGGAGSGRRSAAAPVVEPLPPSEEVRLTSLDPRRDEPSTATRNPFEFGRRQSAGATPADVAPSLTAPSPPAPPLVPTGPPAPPPIPLKFIGVLEKGEGQTWAVLSVGDGRGPLHGKEGDIIDGRYRILKIGTESIDMVYLDGRGRQTIRLTGQ